MCVLLGFGAHELLLQGSKKVKKTDGFDMTKNWLPPKSADQKILKISVLYWYICVLLLLL